ERALMGTDYWTSRRRAVPASGLRAIKRFIISSNTVGAAFSMRTDDERFLLKAFRKYSIQSVLDVACGPGKVVVGQLPYSAGVDIKGAPTDVAKSLGYVETH